jgi:hypothetical protein
MTTIQDGWEQRDRDAYAFILAFTGFPDRYPLRRFFRLVCECLALAERGIPGPGAPGLEAAGALCGETEAVDAFPQAALFAGMDSAILFSFMVNPGCG